MLPPKKDYIEFKSEIEQFEFFKECGLLSKNRKTFKTEFLYKGLYTKEPLKCEVVGYIDTNEIVIKFKDNKLHCIHPHYLKDMQKSSFVINSS